MDSDMAASLATLRAGMAARMPTVMVGPPGVGKTALIMAEVENNLPGYEFISLVGSQMEPSDITGFPKGATVGIDADGTPIEGTTYLKPWWQVRILLHKKVVLFLDEFSNTAPAVRAAMLVLLQDRRFPDGTPFPQETIVLGAMNPPEQSPSGYELDLPTGNRLMVLRWFPPFSFWREGMLKAWGKQVSAEEMQWKRDIVSFLTDNTKHFYNLPDELENGSIFGVDEKDYSEMTVMRTAWPSHRSWDSLSRVLSHVDRNDEKTLTKTMQGIVGYKAAVDFLQWLQAEKKLDVSAILRDPDSVDWMTMGLSDGKLLFSSLVEQVTEDNAVSIVKVFISAGQAGRYDLGVPYIKQLLKNATNNSFSEESQDPIRDTIRDLIGLYRPVMKKS